MTSDDFNTQRLGAAGRRRRALLATGVAAAAVTAIGVPAALWLRGRPMAPSPTGPNLPLPAPEPHSAGNLRVPMRLRPNWLPDGLVEFERSAQVHGQAQSRRWATPEAIAALASGASLEVLSAAAWVTLSVDAAVPAPTQEPLPPNVSVGGRPAWLRAGDHQPSHLQWSPEVGITATIDVSATLGSGGIALRIAEGLVADGVGGCETSLRFGWLPEQAGDRMDISVFGWNGSWDQSLEARAKLDIAYTPPVRARLVTDRRQMSELDVDRSGEPVTLRGRPGFARIGAGYGEAAVELAGGRWLRVLCYLGGDGPRERDCVVRVLNEMVIGPDPYLGWIGQR